LLGFGRPVAAWIGILLGAGLVPLAGLPLRAAGCAECHEQAAQLPKSAHASLTCDTCHENHEEYPHPAGIAKPQCESCHDAEAQDFSAGVHAQARKAGNQGTPDCALCHGSAHELLPAKAQAFRAAVPDTCGMCHTSIAAQYKSSVHGKALASGVGQAPLCTDCHGGHKIIRHTSDSSPVNAANIRDTCGGCHGNVQLTRKFGMPSDRLVSFDASYHGLAAKAGSQSVANCASCHGVHNILPSSDPKSTIYPKNLAATCGKCHPGAGSRFVISQVHVVDGVSDSKAVRWVRGLYLGMIPVVIGLMFIHNFGDWMRKTIRLRSQRPPRRRAAVIAMAGREEIRMLPFERLQHALLALAFFVLIWTGFALKYPDQWWARPLLLLEGRHPLRSLIHRFAAVLCIGLGVTHAVSLIVNRRLREHWKEMLPNRHDPREALSGFAYSLGLGRTPPQRSSHNYIGKAEYWAAVWGVIVMSVTGGLLWAHNLVLQLLPKEWLDVATAVHFYEATLAALAIAVWHFYWTIFDPDVYPLNTSFLNGKSVEKKDGESASGREN
jgi:cytochrome b subunit of formate dehydrogenase